MRKSLKKMPDSFASKLKIKWDEGKFVCVGLDSDYDKLPDSAKAAGSIQNALYTFNRSIIDKTFDLVCAYKINTAFYESTPDTWSAMQKTIQDINMMHPDIPVILDAKRGDIGNTNLGYIKMAFTTMNADAITVSPYLGKESLQPFLVQENKGIIVLVRTSNEGSDEFQELMVNGQPLYQIIAQNVAASWNINGNCAVVMGATHPEELKKVREIIGDMPILVPGIGAQGGNLEAVIKNGLNSSKQGLIINSSRGIIFAEDPRQATQKLHDEIGRLING